MSQYVTVAEFKQSPTQIDPSTLDITNLGNASAQDAALNNVLRRASSWVDRIVQMRTLQATTNTESKEIYIRRDGRITIWPDNAPIVSLSYFGYRMAPNALYSSIPLEYIQAFNNRFTVWNINSNTLSPALLLQNQGANFYSPYAMSKLRDMPVQVQYTYVNGYFNGMLSADVTADATQLVVTPALGLQPGSVFNIYDGYDSEDNLVVDHVDSANPNLVYLTAPLAFSHVAGTPASSLPESVKQATILLAGSLIKQRGSSAVVMGETNMQGATQKFNSTADEDLARDLLAPLIRVVTSSE